jgi:RNA polymerase sigma-32 factor
MNRLANMDSLALYRREIGNLPVLSREEEFDLATRYRRSGDLDAAWKLVTHNLRFVMSMAREYARFGASMQDLVQEGGMGLMMAVRKFNPEKGYRLITYAAWWIRAYMTNFIVRTWSVVSKGTTRAERGLLKFLAGKDAREEADEDLRRLSMRDFHVDFKDAEAEAPPVRALASESASQEEMLIESEEGREARARVSEAVKRLTPAERKVIEQRYYKEEPVSLAEVGREQNLSRERIRQIEKSALEKVKGYLEGDTAQ